MRPKALPIVVPIAQARRRREMTEKSDNGGVYMMYTSYKEITPDSYDREAGG
jgi:hypothetical protein